MCVFVGAAELVKLKKSTDMFIGERRPSCDRTRPNFRSAPNSDEMDDDVTLCKRSVTTTAKAQRLPQPY